MTKINKDIINTAKQLFSKSFTQEANEAKETMEQFDKLYKDNKTNEEVAFIYAKGLLNLVDKLQIDDAIATIEKLKVLLENHKSNQPIAVRYARGLANLIHKQNAENAVASMKQLEALYNEYIDNSEVASGYVGGLINCAIKGSDADNTIDTITSLLDRFKDDAGFVKFAERAIKIVGNMDVN